MPNMRKINARKNRTLKNDWTSRTVTVSEFKLKCVALLDEVEKTKKAIVITRRGKPIARLVPSLLGLFKGRMKVVGDIISPIDVKWEYDERNLRKTPELWRDGD
jgi:prevent-host-death family protein